MARTSRRAAAWLALAALAGCLGAAAGQESACVAAAAGLAPCVVANTPLSSLTAAEEATCCEALAAFSRAGCFCVTELAGDVVHEYWKRAQALAVPHEQCGAPRVTCPSGPPILPHNARPPHQLLQQREPAALQRQPQLAGAAAADAAAQLVVQLLSREGEQALAQALAAQTAELAALLQEGRELQVELSVEMTVQPERGAAQDWAAWAREPVLLACALLALLTGALLCAGRGRRQQQAQQQRPADACGVVLAAEEARQQPPLCGCACKA